MLGTPWRGMALAGKSIAVAAGHALGRFPFVSRRILVRGDMSMSFGFWTGNRHPENTIRRLILPSCMRRRRWLTATSCMYYNFIFQIGSSLSHCSSVSQPGKISCACACRRWFTFTRQLKHFMQKLEPNSGHALIAKIAFVQRGCHIQECAWPPIQRSSETGLQRLSPGMRIRRSTIGGGLLSPSQLAIVPEPVRPNLRLFEVLVFVSLQQLLLLVFGDSSVFKVVHLAVSAHGFKSLCTYPACHAVLLEFLVLRPTYLSHLLVLLDRVYDVVLVEAGEEDVARVPAPHPLFALWGTCRFGGGRSSTRAPGQPAHGYGASIRRRSDAVCEVH
jgi:hypothetical protein